MSTVLRLRDGESNLLAGLLQEQDRRVLRGFPGTLRLPILRHLFASTDDTVVQTDIVMLLTPHIIRSHELTQADLSPIHIGTQRNVGLTGPPPLIAPPPEAAAPAPPPAAAPPPPAVAPVPEAPPLTVPVPGAAEIIVTPPGLEFRVDGGPYTVPISINAASQVSTMTITLTYNPTVLRVRAVEEGSFLRQGSLEVAFTQEVDPVWPVGSTSA